MIIQSLENNPSTSLSLSSSNLLGKETFLKLFVAELTNQNPMEPMDNKDFVTQMAQFSSLEQLNNLNLNLGSIFQMQMLYQAGQMIGYRVEGTDPSTGELVRGVVEEVLWEENNIYLVIGKKSIPFSSIVRIISKN